MAEQAFPRAAVEAFLAEPRNVMVAGIRANGRPQMTPNWFYWDGSRFYISTTATRQKYRTFRRDPRVQLAFDDPTGFKCLLIDGTVAIWEDIDQGLPFFQAIMRKHRGDAVPDEATTRARLIAERRVLLVITPDKPLEACTQWGFSA